MKECIVKNESLEFAKKATISFKKAGESFYWSELLKYANAVSSAFTETENLNQE